MVETMLLTFCRSLFLKMLYRY